MYKCIRKNKTHRIMRILEPKKQKEVVNICKIYSIIKKLMASAKLRWQQIQKMIPQ